MGDLAMNTSALALPVSHQSQGSSATAVPAQETKPKKKICCACPDTKKLRDECIVDHGEEACSKWIEAHLKSQRDSMFECSELRYKPSFDDAAKLLHSTLTIDAIAAKETNIKE